MFKAEKASILAALKSARGAIEKRNTIPILGNVLFDDGGEAGLLRLRATDLDIEITASFAAVVDEAFQPFTAPAVMLTSIVEKIGGTEIRIEPSNDAGGRLQEIIIKSGRSRFRLPVLPAEDFPNLPEINASPFEIDAQAFSQALAETAFAVSTDEARHYLHGVFFHRRKDDIALVATDGHRLSVRVIEAGNAPANLPSVIIPTKAVNLLKGSLPEAGTISLAISDSRIALAYAGTHISSKLVDGTFPDYERLLVDNKGNVLQTDRRTLLESVRRVSLVSTRKTHPVKLICTNDTLTVELIDNDAGEASEDMDCECDFETTIGVNYSYLAEALEHTPGGNVSIIMNDADRLAITSKDGHPDDTIITMLMRVK